MLRTANCLLVNSYSSVVLALFAVWTGLKTVSGLLALALQAYNKSFPLILRHLFTDSTTKLFVRETYLGLLKTRRFVSFYAIIRVSVAISVRSSATSCRFPQWSDMISYLTQ